MSSLPFSPSQGAAANGTWDTTFLSDRDVSARVPVNFVPHPGVYVSAACFAGGLYDEASAQTCISNLLASQIRRYVLDVYWDALNRKFGLCPAEIPSSSAYSTSTASPDTISSSTFSSSQPTLSARQNSASSTTNATRSLSSSTSSSTSTVASATPSSLGPGGVQVIDIGPYQCSPTFSLSSVISIYQSYLAYTADNIQAKIVTLLLNVHAASSSDDPTSPSPALTQSQLPTSQQLLSTYFDGISSLIYTPTTLLKDRSNLNDSWFNQPTPENRPLTNYFTIDRLSNGILTTEDGWPGEDYIQVTLGKRILIGFGDIDPEISGYDTAADGARIFPPNYIASETDPAYDSNGELQNGCYYNPNSTSVSQANSSWAFAAINKVNPPDLGDTADNLTVCGLSQMLNSTIDDSLADVDPDPYQTFGNNAIFSWAYGQPENDTRVQSSEADKFRCALMVSDNAYRGHWRVEYCTESYHVACRRNNQPYEWSISSYKVPFGAADDACTQNSIFDVPRTGLENTYLYHHILGDVQRSGNDDTLDGIWINFNSLAVENCWVPTGVNGSCPYLENSDAVHDRQVLIPAIAALIVLLLTALTVLVKCSTNARNSRVRRRGEGGWDYEGVPS